MVFYFTGTGNSLYVAGKIEEKPISIPQVMRGTEREFTADSIGIVCPVYGHEAPRSWQSSCAMNAESMSAISMWY